jgi:RHS repeat-associated protein
VLIDPRHPPIDLGDLVAKILLALLLAAGIVTIAAGLIGKKRRPAWVAFTAGPVVLFFIASCDKMGTSRSSAETVWQRIEVVYFHQGLAAGPALTTNADGTLREERRYEPFGQPVDANVAGTLGPVDFRRELQNSLGKLTNPNTGWSYHGARWMQPQTARWTSPDAAVKGPDLGTFGRNPYAYVNQNPVLSWDPTGNFEDPVHGALTYKLAIAAGFSAKDAAKIALADAGVDHNVRTRPIGGDSLKGYAEGARKLFDGTLHEYHFLSYGDALKAVREEMAEGQYMGMQEFGKALHTLQDVGFKDAPGPHKRGFHIFGENGMHGTYRTGSGKVSLGPDHTADKAFSDPEANRKELRKVYDLMKQAASGYGVQGPANDAAAYKAIDDLINAKTKDQIVDFMSAPVGSAPSYYDQVQNNNDSRSPVTGVPKYPASEVETGF